MNKKIITNTIENTTFELYTNGNKNSYQTIKMTNTKTGKTLENKVIAPVDFFTVINAITYHERLCDVIDDCSDTWAAEVLEDMIHEIANDGE